MWHTKRHPCDTQRVNHVSHVTHSMLSMCHMWHKTCHPCDTRRVTQVTHDVSPKWHTTNHQCDTQSVTHVTHDVSPIKLCVNYVTHCYILCHPSHPLLCHTIITLSHTLLKCDTDCVTHAHKKKVFLGHDNIQCSLKSGGKQSCRVFLVLKYWTKFTEHKKDIGWHKKVMWRYHGQFMKSKMN